VTHGLALPVVRPEGLDLLGASFLYHNLTFTVRFL
jgi:hypothetical protein